MADDILKEALEAFKAASEAEADNRAAALDDIRFSRLAEQWPEDVKSQRETEGRPCLTINKLPAFIRQVINDSRQNSPSIKVHPADSIADPDTAEIINGLIRNIEVTSDADVAYDTGLDCAVTSGFGFWRVNVDYAFDDSFDKDIVIHAVPNQFSIYGDPYSTKSDSSDWNTAFVLDTLTQEQFKRKYKGADPKSTWQVEYNELPAPWGGEDSITIAEYWTRSEVKKIIVRLSDDTVMDAEQYKKNQEMFQMLGLEVIGDRETRGYKVKQRIMTGAEVLETNDWAGRYIPIISVYGEEVNVEGRRHLRSLVRDAKDPQRMFNYWRSASTELVALAPKTPFIGPKGAFTTDSEKWASANTKSHAYIEFDGPIPPQRQPFAGVPAGALQEALNASDDIKSIIGIYDAAMGARSNETSGKAIMARQRESDVSTFHFIDNLNRAIRHTGRVLIDLIPHVYSGERVVRILGGEDRKTPENVRINAPVKLPDGTEKIYDLTAGKYDLTVDSGPSFTTRREEAASQMIEFVRAFPQAAPFVGDLLAKNLDWPGADEFRKRLEAMLPPELKGDGEQDPQVQVLGQQMEQMKQQGMQLIQQLQEANQKLQADLENKQAETKIKAYEAETKRMAVENNLNEAMSDARFKAVDAIEKAMAKQPQQPFIQQQD
ncbi:MAG: portal protein [Methylobacter sp.]